MNEDEAETSKKPRWRWWMLSEKGVIIIAQIPRYCPDCYLKAALFLLPIHCTAIGLQLMALSFQLICSLHFFSTATFTLLEIDKTRFGSMLNTREAFEECGELRGMCKCHENQVPIP